MKPASNKRLLHVVVIAISAVVVFVIGTLNLESIPPLWPDEGWTLCAARTWAETGSYGCMQLGEPISPTRSASIVVVAPVALSFKLFGVGIYQARVVGVVLAVTLLLLMYGLTMKLYGAPVALCTMVLLLILPVKWGLHPLFMGRQVLGETPSLLYLLAAFSCFVLVERRPLVFLPLAILGWGIAWTAKLQVAPFLVIAFLVPLFIAAVRREWKMVRLLSLSLAGAFLVSRVLILVKNYLVGGATLSDETTTGLVQAAAMVFLPSVRLSTFAFAISFGLPTLIGLAYVLWLRMRTSNERGPLSIPAVIEIMMTTLAGSWFAWYVLLSIGWERYAYPPVFLATPFLALFIRDATHGFKIKDTIKRALSCIARRQADRSGLLALNVTLLGALMVFLTSVALYKFHSSAEDNSIVEVANYLNTATPENAVVETLESELLFLLQRKYHYPPAQVDVVIIRHTWFGDQTPFEYDPLACKPDYLVVGGEGDWSGVYKGVIEQGAFRPERTIGRYRVYKRAPQ